MSKINELIAQYCPEGVAFKQIGEVTKVLRGRRLTKSLLSEEGKYPVFHGGLEPLGKYQQSNRPANTVMIINVGASAGTVGFSKVDFWSSDGCYCLENNESLLSRFLYHYLLTAEHVLRSRVRRAGIPTLDAIVIEKIYIPIPPLPVQEEIVKILDKFNQLEAELEARTRQYEYYRNQLLSFEGKEVEWKTLGEVSYYSKKRVSSDLVNEDNYVGVENLLQNRKGLTKSNYVPAEGNLIEFLSDDILIGNIRPYLKKIWKAKFSGGTNGDVLVFRISEEYLGNIYSAFLYHLLASDKFFTYNMQFAKGAKMPRGDKDSILKYKIPIPSLEEQERIVKILDQFDALVNDISVGIPAEIKARREQYEYYRQKLLTFQPLVNS